MHSCKNILSFGQTICSKLWLYLLTPILFEIIKLGENRLGLNYVLEFFDALSTLVNVREMHLEVRDYDSVDNQR